MALTESGFTGRRTKQETDSVTGLLLQDSDSMTQNPSMDGGSDPAAEASVTVKVSYGVPFVMQAVCHGAETDGHTHNFAVFSKNAPFKFVVLGAQATVLDESSGTLTGDTLALWRGDGASGEAFTQMTQDMSPSSSNEDEHWNMVPDGATLNQDVAVVDKDESLRIAMVLADATDHNLAVKVTIWGMRCQASE